MLEHLADSDGLLPIISRDNIHRVQNVITFENMTRLLGRRRKT